MKYQAAGLSICVLALAGCSVGGMHSFPTPGSYNPLATRQPIDPGTVAIAREVHKIDRAIDEGRESGQVSKREARSLRRANRVLAATADRLAADGLSPGEQRDLETHAQILDSQVQAARFVNDRPKRD